MSLRFHEFFNYRFHPKKQLQFAGASTEQVSSDIEFDEVVPQMMLIFSSFVHPLLNSTWFILAWCSLKSGDGGLRCVTGGTGRKWGCLVVFLTVPSYKEISGGSNLCTPNQPSVASTGGERERSAAPAVAIGDVKQAAIARPGYWSPSMHPGEKKSFDQAVMIVFIQSWGDWSEEHMATDQ